MVWETLLRMEAERTYVRVSEGLVRGQATTGIAIAYARKLHGQ